MNYSYAIVADITCDLSPQLIKRFEIDGHLPGIMSTPTDESVEGRLDLTEAELDAFYSSLKSNKNKYKTSPPSMDKMMQFFEQFLLAGKDVLAVSMSSGLSATYNLMLRAEQTLTQKYPQRKICVVDSRKYSIGVGLLAVKASEFRKKGFSIEQNVEQIEQIKKTLHQMGPIDDLFWVASKGRISHSKAFFGTIAGIKPLGDFDSDGMVSVLAKVSGRENANKVSIEYIKKTIKSPQDQIVFVAHSARKKQAEEFAKLIEEKIKPKEVIITNLYPFSGINVGPGLVAAYYLGTEITDLAYEKEVMREIIASKL
ncbi:MAG: DegV family protein [Firmicutes bacterium]|nr:DegV family protein [Bacillota bacterium]